MTGMMANENNSTHPTPQAVPGSARPFDRADPLGRVPARRAAAVRARAHGLLWRRPAGGARGAAIHADDGPDHVLVGGGGGGGAIDGGGTNRCGGGGGGGHVKHGDLDISSNLTITIGAAGAGGSGTPYYGGAGGDSSITGTGVSVTAYGGTGGGGGSGVNSYGRDGNGNTGGSANSTGTGFGGGGAGAGGQPPNLIAYDTSGQPGTSVYGYMGNSRQTSLGNPYEATAGPGLLGYGGGGSGGATTSLYLGAGLDGGAPGQEDGAGNDAVDYGGGGGGAHQSAATAADGGDGYQGVCILTWFE